MISTIEKNLEVVQNIESTVVDLWRANREMTDYVALRAYEAAFAHYRAEQRGHVSKPSGLTGLDATVFEALKEMCEYRLGRDSAAGRLVLLPSALPLVELVDCLRELVKSVKRHTDRGGRQGYLLFIDQFLK